MKLLNVNEILISQSRQRQEFDQESLSELTEDIMARGLMQPLVVRTEGSDTVLVAGERRLRALRDLHEFAIPVIFENRQIPLDTAPTVNMGELDEIARFEAELSENVKRKDLTWQERAQADAALHELRSRQAAAKGLTQSFIQTATEIAGAPVLGQPVAEVSTAVKVARHLHDPEVAKAATKREALKVIDRKLTEAHNVKLAQEVGKVAISSRHTIRNEDCRTALATIPSGTFDAICTDPPYGIGSHTFGAQSDQHQYDDSYDQWQILMRDLASHLMRVAKAEAHAYVFCDPERFLELKQYFVEAQWYVWRTPLIWSKGAGTLPRPEHGPRRTYETILYAIKGDKKTTGVFPDVIIQSPEHNTTHPAQKPVSVIQNLLARSTRPGDYVCDPFAGSGTILPAANRLALRAFACEQNPIYYGECLKRQEEK